MTKQRFELLVKLLPAAICCPSDEDPIEVLCQYGASIHITKDEAIIIWSLTPGEMRSAMMGALVMSSFNLTADQLDEHIQERIRVAHPEVLPEP